MLLLRVEKINQYITTLSESIEANTFVRLTLSKNRDKSSDLKKLLIKQAILKGKPHLSFVFRNKTNDVTKNFEITKGIELIKENLESTFFIGNLFTTRKNHSLEIFENGKQLLKSTAPTFTAAPTHQHDKSKNRLVGKSDFLKELGVLDKSGRVQTAMGDKYKQIEKFVEIIDSLLRKNESLFKEKSIKVTDMGSGKGYLTFAIYDFLKNKLEKEAEVIGVEVRDDMIALCNQIAQKVNFKNLSFEKGFISDYDLPATDVLLALHACDTATDDAIYKGIKAKAKLIICSPCCHKQIRKAIQKSETFDPVLNFGILKERQAEIITDTIRALLLEANGYKTKVFEFISTEHTGKNLMIVGQRHEGKVKTKSILKKIEKLKKEFGIEKHYLEELL